MAYLVAGTTQEAIGACHIVEGANISIQRWAHNVTTTKLGPVSSLELYALSSGQAKEFACLTQEQVTPLHGGCAHGLYRTVSKLHGSA